MTPKISVLVFILTLIDFGFVRLHFLCFATLMQADTEKNSREGHSRLEIRSSGLLIVQPNAWKYSLHIQPWPWCFLWPQVSFIRVAVWIVEKHHHCQPYHRRAYRINKRASNKWLFEWLFSSRHISKKFCVGQDFADHPNLFQCHGDKNTRTGKKYRQLLIDFLDTESWISKTKSQVCNERARRD